MRALVKGAAGAALLLALAGCSGSPTGIGALETPARPSDKLDAGLGNVNVLPDSTRLLMEKEDRAFYVALADNFAKHGVCLIIVDLEVDEASAGCGKVGPEPLELGVSGVKAKLIQDRYDASRELAADWEQLHPNLLVWGL
ncbi:hypothetical protein ACMX2H_13950 [Arthrobacter sulfonylureivorans]|uniref:hypothetical protein n=1 Tax=Arthrobacter sulfonylureivorans TaxID=2486855 RepID=UPI0039E5A6F9